MLYAEHLDRAADPRAAQAYLDAARAQSALFHFERANALAERGLEICQERAVSFQLKTDHGEILHNKGELGGSE